MRKNEYKKVTPLCTHFSIDSNFNQKSIVEKTRKNEEKRGKVRNVYHKFELRNCQKSQNKSKNEKKEYIIWNCIEYVV